MSDFNQLTSALAAFAGYFSGTTGITKLFALEATTRKNVRQQTAKFIEAVIATASGGLLMWAAVQYGDLPGIPRTLLILSFVLVMGAAGFYGIQRWRLRRTDLEG